MTSHHYVHSQDLGLSDSNLEGGSIVDTLEPVSMNWRDTELAKETLYPYYYPRWNPGNTDDKGNESYGKETYGSISKGVKEVCGGIVSPEGTDGRISQWLDHERQET